MLTLTGKPAKTSIFNLSKKEKPPKTGKPGKPSTFKDDIPGTAWEADQVQTWERK